MVFFIPFKPANPGVIARHGMGSEHASVSLPNRTPQDVLHQEEPVGEKDMTKP
jgi:hypothetical protein